LWRSTTMSPGKRPSHPSHGHNKPAATKTSPSRINVLDIPHFYSALVYASSVSEPSRIASRKEHYIAPDCRSGAAIAKADSSLAAASAAAIRG